MGECFFLTNGASRTYGKHRPRAPFVKKKPLALQAAQWAQMGHLGRVVFFKRTVVFFNERDPWNLMDSPPFGRMATSGPWPPLPIYAAAYIHSRLCIEPPIWCAALRNAAQRCAMLRNGAQCCAMVRNIGAMLRSVAQHCAALRTIAQMLRTI